MGWESEGVAGEGEGGRGRGSETEEGVKNRRRFSSCGDRKKAENRTKWSRKVFTSQLKTQICMYRHEPEQQSNVYRYQPTGANE